jgi:16S rRNA (cytosine1402-N4)-methyltransferase
MNNYHKSVLLQEVLALLYVKPGKQYIDATLGGGGHTAAIIEAGGNVLGIDVDEDALKFVRAKTERQGAEGRLVLAKGNFQNIDTIAREHGFDQVAGILFDLGVSSFQLDTAEKGFSFQEGPLDMRMDQTLSVRAADLVNGLTNKELQELFVKYGEERYARSIAKHIEEFRKIKQFETTAELADVVRSAVPNLPSTTHPATRVFQALRIAVNDELNVLRDALPKAYSLLGSKGRLAVISFHSLEDRIAKQAFLAFAEDGSGRVLTPKPIEATEGEERDNRRSRSAKLRGIEKL